jgi:hypothetical protein
MTFGCVRMRAMAASSSMTAMRLQLPATRTSGGSSSIEHASTIALNAAARCLPTGGRRNATCAVALAVSDTSTTALRVAFGYQHPHESGSDAISV